MLLMSADANDLRINFFEGSADTADISRENTLGRSLADIWPEADLGSRCRRLIKQNDSVSFYIQSPVQLLTTYQRIMNEDFRTQADGLGVSKMFRYKMWYTAAAMAGEKSTMSIIVQDVTATHAAQEALEKSNTERTIALASENAAKEANLLKTMFVSNVSHEIR